MQNRHYKIKNLIIFVKKEDYKIYKKYKIFTNKLFKKKYFTTILENNFSKQLIEKPACNKAKLIGFLKSIFVAPIFSYHILHLVKKIFHRDKIDKNLNKEIEKFCKKYADIKKVILVTNYYFSFEQALLKKFKEMHAETILIENGWDRICSKLFFSFTPDKIGTLTRSAEFACRRLLGKKPRFVYTVGHPFYWFVSKLKAIKRQNKLIGFYGMTKPALELPRLVALQKICWHLRMNLFYRPHPSRWRRTSEKKMNKIEVKNINTFFDPITSKNLSNRKSLCSQIFSKDDALHSIKKVATMINFWSTLSIEAILLKIPVIWIKPKLEELKLYEFFYYRLPHFKIFKNKKLVCICSRDKNLLDQTKSSLALSASILCARRTKMLQELNLNKTSFIENLTKLIEKKTK